MAPRGCPDPHKPKLAYAELEHDYLLMCVIEMPYGTTFINASHSPETVKAGCGNFALYQKIRLPQSCVKPDCPSNIQYDHFCSSFAVNLRNGNVYNLATREGCENGMAKGYVISVNINFQFDRE